MRRGKLPKYTLLCFFNPNDKENLKNKNIEYELTILFYIHAIK